MVANGGEEVDLVPLGDKVFLEVRVETVFGITDVQTHGTAFNNIINDSAIK